MLYCIISVVALVAACFLLCILNLDDELIFKMMTVLFIVACFVPVVNVALAETYIVEDEELQYAITGLETFVEEKENLKGHFILGTGVLGGENFKEMGYIYFADTNYGKQLKSVGVDEVYIRETDDEIPKYIKIVERIFRKASWVDELFGHKGNEVEVSSREVGKVLVVPTNTIKIEYNIEI